MENYPFKTNDTFNKVDQRYQNSLANDPNLMLTISLTNILILTVGIYLYRHEQQISIDN